MKKSNVAGLETMAAGFLQYRYGIYLHVKKVKGLSWNDPCPDWNYYEGACDMIQAFGGEWRRNYSGADSEEQKLDIANYSHWVIFPDDERCKRLNFDAWK